MVTTTASELASKAVKFGFERLFKVPVITNVSCAVHGLVPKEVLRFDEVDYSVCYLCISEEIELGEAKLIGTPGESKVSSSSGSSTPDPY